LDAWYNFRIKRNRFGQLIHYLKNNMEAEGMNQFFRQTGLTITASQYQLFRYSFFLIWFILIHMTYFFHGGDYGLFPLILLVILFLQTSPRPSFLAKRTLFKYFMDLLIQHHKNKQNMEIYRAISQLKNMAVAKKKEPLGSDFILEQIRKFTKTTRPIFNRMISLWSLGKKEEACDYLTEAIQTKEAEQLANLFRKLDDLNPNELHHHLILLQEVMKRERETKKIKANENQSNLIYFIVISTSMVILINFVVIVYYLETLKQLKFIH